MDSQALEGEASPDFVLIIGLQHATSRLAYPWTALVQRSAHPVDLPEVSAKSVMWQECDVISDLGECVLRMNHHGMQMLETQQQ